MKQVLIHNILKQSTYTQDSELYKSLVKALNKLTLDELSNLKFILQFK